ncbi:MAG: 4'-phosphopantetheinyl transferase family protein [Geminicoccaceae bacterium]
MGDGSDNAPSFETDTIGVWWVDLDAPAPANDVLLDLLDDHERQRARRFRKTEHQDAYVRSHAALRQILGARLDCRPEDIHLAHPDGGKPFVQRPADQATLDFSLSHADNIALVAVSARGRIGVDVERTAPPDSLAIARRWFAEDEIAWLEPLSEPERSASFLACWTAKEAHLKALGLGLSGDLRACRCRLTAGDDVVPEVMDERDAIDHRWRLVPLTRGEAVGCLAIQDNEAEPDISVFAWS